MDQLEAARAVRESGRWGDAWRALSALPVDELAIDDLDQLATSAYLTGHDEEAFGVWTSAFQRCVEEGTTHRAAAFGASLARAPRVQGRPPPLWRMDPAEWRSCSRPSRSTASSRAGLSTGWASAASSSMATSRART